MLYSNAEHWEHRDTKKSYSLLTTIYSRPVEALKTLMFPKPLETECLNCGTAVVGTTGSCPKDQLKGESVMFFILNEEVFCRPKKVYWRKWTLKIRPVYAETGPQPWISPQGLSLTAPDCTTTTQKTQPHKSHEKQSWTRHVVWQASKCPRCALNTKPN